MTASRTTSHEAVLRSNRLRPLIIEYVRPSVLKTYDNHPRTHSDKQIAKLINSVEAFAVMPPILVDGDLQIIDGDARLIAALKMELLEVPIIKTEHLNDAELKALRIALNRIQEDGEWDQAKLKLEFEAILDEMPDFHLEVTGFDSPQIDLTLNLFVGEEPEMVEAPEEGAAPITRPGDIWLLGEHRLVCGDSRDNSVFTRLMEGEKAQAVFTDPPYNVAIDGHVGNSGAIKHNEFAMASGEMSDEEFNTFLATTLSHMKSHTSDGGIIFSCMDWRHIEDLIRAGRVNDLDLLNIIVWVKNNGGMGSLYRSRHEMIAVFKNGKTAHTNNVQLGKFGRYRTNVWEYPGVNTFKKGRMDELIMHPTVKPVAMVAEALMDVTQRGDIVLDPFGGSGSTLVAAEKTGRRSRLIEYEPKYCDVIVRRWQEFTGLRATHEDTRMTFDDLADLRGFSEGDVQ